MMKKITIKNLNDKIDIIVDKIKYVCGNDYESKDKIKKVLINKFNKISQSDYAEDNYISEVLIDDEPIILNDYLFFYVDSNYDLLQDSKLGVKSISLEYINALFENIEFTEEYQTINNLLIDLLDKQINDSDYLIKSNIECTLTKKLLTKLIEFSFINEDNKINNYDLTLEQKILIQLNMIKKISIKTNKNIILLIDCPVITKSIKEVIGNIDATSIVLFERIEKDNFKDLLILDNIRIDTLDDNAIFELCNNCKTTFLSIEEMKEKLLNDYLIPRFI